ncbi:MAG: hypothetical protein SGPRY_007046, partial [Prymnesium sp.]
VGFIESVVKDASKRLTILPGALFAAGFSNGGFFTSTLPSRSRLKWAALSPAAGHEYSVQAPSPTAVYIHHCANDEKVLISGCCQSQVQLLLWDWGGAKGVHLDALLEIRMPVLRIGFACIQVGMGCAVNTTLCVHQGCVHGDWVYKFPAAWSVVHFFAREACAASGGRLVGHQRDASRCACGENSRGRWCSERHSNDGKSLHGSRPHQREEEL